MANETTSSTLDDLFANIILQARHVATENAIMLGLVTRHDIAGVAGKTIQIPKYPAISAADLTEGTDMSATEVATTSVTATVAEVGAQVVMTDMAAYGSGNVAQELGTVLGNAIATKIDTDLIALFDGFSTSLGGAGTEVTAADFFKAAAILRNAKAVGTPVAVVHPYHAYQLSANLTNTFANPNGGDLQNEAMRQGFVGSIAGIDVYQSANITVDGNGDAKGLCFVPEAMVIAMKNEFNLETERNASLRAFELNATAVYGVAELDDTYGVEMFFDATV